MATRPLLTDQAIKKLENTYLSLYPILRQPGMYRPAAKGRTILNPGQVLALFHEKDDADYLIDVSVFVTAKRLSEVFKDERFKNEELPAILNQHFDFAELLLLHHSKRIEGLYDNNIEAVEAKRGEYLRQLALADDAVPTCWAEYAYWLNGRFEKLEASDPVAAACAIEEAEKYLRQAHHAGYIEATEALATLIYTGTDKVGEALFYWEKAAVAGNVVSIQSLFNVVMGDSRVTPDEFVRSISCIWQGVTVNKKETKEVIAALHKAGFEKPAKVDRALALV